MSPGLCQIFVKPGSHSVFQRISWILNPPSCSSRRRRASQLRFEIQRTPLPTLFFDEKDLVVFVPLPSSETHETVRTKPAYADDRAKVIHDFLRCMEEPISTWELVSTFIPAALSPFARHAVGFDSRPHLFRSSRSLLLSLSLRFWRLGHSKLFFQTLPMSTPTETIITVAVL